MRLGWAKTKYSISYYVQKTIYVNGKNKSQVVKRLGSEKYICETYGVTDAKAWAKEQVRLMNEAEKADAARFTIELYSGADLVMDEQRRFNGGSCILFMDQGGVYEDRTPDQIFDHPQRERTRISSTASAPGSMPSRRTSTSMR